MSGFGVRDGRASEDDVEQRDEVHHRHERRYGVKAVSVKPLDTRDAGEHEGDTKFDGYHGETPEDFEQEEPLLVLVSQDVP